MKPFVKADLDGFFALALDNLINLLLISSFCLGMLGFSPAIFYGHILPATAVSLVIGNVFYARQALALAKREKRNDVCALPYGINLFTVFAFSLLVMLPAQQAALAAGQSKPAADLIAWHAGIAACLGSAVIEIVGGWWADHLRKFIPRAALLATPAMVGLLLISADFFFKCVAFPLIGFTTLGIVIGVYYGGMKLRRGFPAALLVLMVGTLFAWLFHHGGSDALVPVGTLAADQVGFHLPQPIIGDLWHSLPYLIPYLPVTIPMGLLNLIGSLQSLESAAAAGDNFPGRPALLMNGMGTLGAALCGSPFTTTLYYGHPGWKALGARAGYSTLNAAFFTAILLTGTLSYIIYVVPVEAGMAILVWIGATIFIQAFSAVPAKHYPAVAFGMLPIVGGFTALVIRNAIAGSGIVFTPELLTKIGKSRNVAVNGIFAIDSGYIFMSVLWAGATVSVIERRFFKAGLWMLACAVFSAFGFMHSFRIMPVDVVSVIQPAWPWVRAYMAIAAVFFAIPWIAQPDDSGAHVG